MVLIISQLLNWFQWKEMCEIIQKIELAFLPPLKKYKTGKPFQTKGLPRIEMLKWNNLNWIWMNTFNYIVIRPVDMMLMSTIENSEANKNPSKNTQKTQQKMIV